jgi:molecular chaperone GrpE
MADKKKEGNPGFEEPGEDAIDGGEIVLEEEAPEAPAAETTTADIKAVEARNAELIDGLQRMQAEFDNYRKRMVREQTRILETAEAGLIKKLLPAIDNLERAIDNAGEVKQAKALAQGVSMVRDQLMEVLEKEGLEVIEGQGEPFDPEEQEAMMVVPSSGQPEGTVVDVTQKGYRFNGSLLRPAMVSVAGPDEGK